MTRSCPGCGTPLADGPCPRCGPEPVLDGRYRLVRPLAGDPSRGTATWEAVRIDDGVRFAAHRGPAGRGPDPHDQALVQITHPRLAAVVEVIRAGEAPWRIQEWVGAPDLAGDAGVRRWGEDDVLQLVEEIADALEHLHGLSPPLIHGDLKPAHVRRSPTGVVLVGFGAPGDPRSPWTAPEVARGRPPTPRSDLYALGALAVALLTGEPPARLAGGDGRLRWRAKASVRPETRRLLDALVDPVPGERPASARAVRDQIRAILDGEWATVPVPTVRAAPADAGLGWIAAGALSVVGMHVSTGTLLVLTVLAADRLGIATPWPHRITLGWLATLPLSQVLYVGPAFALASRAHAPLARGVAVGGGLTVALYLGAAVLTLLLSGR